MVGMMSIETTKKPYLGLLIQGRKLIACLDGSVQLDLK
jgi:hypothetical protein